MQDEIRAVIEAARAWNRAQTKSEAEEALQDAVKAFEDALVLHGEKRSSGFVQDSTWGEVRPGWWVQTPKGEWLEVFGVDSGGPFRVGLMLESGAHWFPRDPTGPVKVRKHTKAVTPEDALAMFAKEFPGTEILEEK
jgi:hypothetical protein